MDLGLNPPLPGDRLGPYRLIDTLGVGGTATEIGRAHV